MPRMLLWIPFALAVTLLASCTKDATGPGRDASLVISAPDSSLAVGQQAQLSAKLVDDRGRSKDVTPSWTSSDSNVLTVSSSGLLSALGEGVTTVTAEYEGKTASLEIRVEGVLARVTIASGEGASHVVRVLSLLDSASYRNSASLSVTKDSIRGGLLMAANAGNEPILLGFTRGGDAELSVRSTAMAALSFFFVRPFVVVSSVADLRVLEDKALRHSAFPHLESLIRAQVVGGKTFYESEEVLDYVGLIALDVIKETELPKPAESRANFDHSPFGNGNLRYSKLPLRAWDLVTSPDYRIYNDGYIWFHVALMDTSNSKTKPIAEAIVDRRVNQLLPFKIGPSTHVDVGPGSADGPIRIVVGQNRRTKQLRMEQGMFNILFMLNEALFPNLPATYMEFARDALIETVLPSRLEKWAEMEDPYDFAFDVLSTISLNIPAYSASYATKIGLKSVGFDMGSRAALRIIAAPVWIHSVAEIVTERAPLLAAWGLYRNESDSLLICQKHGSFVSCGLDGTFDVTLRARGTVNGSPVSCAFEMTLVAKQDGERFTGTTYGEHQRGCTTGQYWLTVNPDNVSVSGTLSDKNIQLLWGDGMEFSGTLKPNGGFEVMGLSPIEAGPYSVVLSWDATPQSVSESRASLSRSPDPVRFQDGPRGTPIGFVEVSSR